ncbi:hypothetical protein ILYODFUR_034329 [Ilyodon furcidens]|uniref:Uncharacterized protein n=1 Tax=Ilyodon furcidens TaxID=33524 RepID=A0ABV0UDS2_9TELE
MWCNVKFPVSSYNPSSPTCQESGLFVSVWLVLCSWNLASPLEDTGGSVLLAASHSLLSVNLCGNQSSLSSHVIHCVAFHAKAPLIFLPKATSKLRPSSSCSCQDNICN